MCPKFGSASLVEEGHPGKIINKLLKRNIQVKFYTKGLKC